MSLTATPERIAQLQVTTESPTVQYTITQNRVVLRDILLSRTDSDSSRYYVDIAIIPENESLSDIHYIYHELLLRSNETLTLSESKLVLHQGDTLYIKTTGGNVSIYASGGAYVEVD